MWTSKWAYTRPKCECSSSTSAVNLPRSYESASCGVGMSGHDARRCWSCRSLPHRVSHGTTLTHSTGIVWSSRSHDPAVRDGVTCCGRFRCVTSKTRGRDMQKRNPRTDTLDTGDARSGSSAGVPVPRRLPTIWTVQQFPITPMQRDHLLHVVVCKPMLHYIAGCNDIMTANCCILGLCAPSLADFPAPSGTKLAPSAGAVPKAIRNHR